jgi:hypothetical protein
MALVLIKEDGTGKPDANSYASLADGDAYHEGQLYASAWTAASTGNKEIALVMATRLLDEFIQFNGLKRSKAQALQWPRRDCPDPDGEGAIGETVIPAVLRHATAELARALLISDRTGDPDGEGLRTMSIEGALAIEFDKNDRRKVLPLRVQVMLFIFGAFRPGSSVTVSLTRT